MKKLMFIVALAVLGTGAASAQTNQKEKRKEKHTTTHNHGVRQSAQATPQERAERLTVSMTEQLALTAEQVAKVQEINLSRFTEQHDLRQKNQGTADRDAMRGQMKALRQKYDTELKAAITTDQYAKYEANQAKGKERNGKRTRNI